MKNSKQLLADFNALDGTVDEILNELIGKNLSKRVLEDEDIEDCCNYQTFVDDLTGENIDFRFVGIDAGGNLLGVREDDSFFETGTLRLTNILLRSKIELIGLLEL